MLENRSIFSIFLLFIVHCSLFIVKAQSRISEQAEVSLLTVSPGDQVYSAFGHTGIRFRDPETNMDNVWNYGTFDFNQPNFILNFMRGKMNYQLAVEPFDSFLMQYRDIEKRSVIEQKLNLTSLQKQKLWAFILHNYEPENRFYKYDFFFDNCATRPRDVLEKVLDKDLEWSVDAISSQERDRLKHMTFRDLLHDKLDNSPWLRVGIDLVLGSPTDQITTDRQKMFLPDYLSNAVGSTHIQVVPDSIGAKITRKPIATQSQQLVTFQQDIPTWWQKYFPEIFLVLCFGIWKIMAYRRWHKTDSWEMPLTRIDGLVFFALGFLGIVICLLWFATDHQTTAWNYTLLWALPSHLIVGISLIRKKCPEWIKIYLNVYSIAMIPIGAVALILVFFGKMFVAPFIVLLSILFSIRLQYAKS